MSVTLILSVIAVCVVICRRAPASVVYVWYTAWRGSMCSACTRRQATRHCVIRRTLGGADTSDKGRGTPSRSIQSRDGSGSYFITPLTTHDELRDPGLCFARTPCNYIALTHTHNTRNSAVADKPRDAFVQYAIINHCRCCGCRI